ncbi:MAG: PUA domain-containing protein [Candidatus Bathyarchaeia archaeon]
MGEKSRPKLSKRRVLGRKDADRIREEAESFLETVDFKTMSRAELEDGTVVYLFDGSIRLALKDGFLFPVLTNPGIVNLPSVVVDMGAIPYVCNGADVMAPGIEEIRGEFEEGDFVVIRDVSYGKALSVGSSLESSEEMRRMRKGKAVKNLHYVGDRLWKALE